MWTFSYLQTMGADIFASVSLAASHWTKLPFTSYLSRPSVVELLFFFKEDRDLIGETWRSFPLSVLCRRLRKVGRPLSCIGGHAWGN